MRLETVPWLRIKIGRRISHPACCNPPAIPPVNSQVVDLVEPKLRQRR